MMDEREEFYLKVSEILNIPHQYTTPVKRRNRWTARRLGNGRFPGYGLIQCFGGQVRVMRRGHETRWFQSYQDVYDMLERERDNNV